MDDTNDQKIMTSEELGISSDALEQAKNSPGSSVGEDSQSPEQQIALARAIAAIKAQRRRNTKGAGAVPETTKLSRKESKKYSKPESKKSIEANKTSNLPKMMTSGSSAKGQSRKMHKKIMKSL